MHRVAEIVNKKNAIFLMNQFLSTERFQEKVLNSMHDRFNVFKNDPYIYDQTFIRRSFDVLDFV